WQSGPALPVSRSNLSAAIDRHGRIFVLGGSTPSGSALVTNVDVYNTASRTWSRAGALRSGRFEALATATPDGRIWLLGGYNALGDPLRTMQVFTPAA
ncbi:MAG TPA: kelch repeat-containing protein, partial [Candidatus Limnocylindrales bacterium]|nr:kelch repeat-containing protein [Candidatus Limnocylindrales bacterium]